MGDDIKVLIFGKEGCPYTEGALNDFNSRKVALAYFDVEKDKTAMKKMLEYSRGKRVVPVIIEEGKVTIGYGGS